MEANDRHAAPGREPTRQTSEGVIQTFQLAVDGDPKRLEDSGGRIDRPAPSRSGIGPTHQVGQFGRRSDRPDPSDLDDPARDAAAEPLLSILVKQVRQLLLGQSVDQIGGRGTVVILRVEPHVERSIATKAEPPVLPGKLVGREAQIKHDPVNRVKALCLQHLVKSVVAGMEQPDRQSLRGLGGQGQHGRVAVQAQNPSRRAHPSRQRRGVSPGPDRPIDDPGPLARCEPIQHLIQQDGPMDRSRRFLGMRAQGGLGEKEG